MRNLKKTKKAVSELLGVNKCMRVEVEVVVWHFELHELADADIQRVTPGDSLTGLRSFINHTVLVRPGNSVMMMRLFAYPQAGYILLHVAAICSRFARVAVLYCPLHACGSLLQAPLLVLTTNSDTGRSRGPIEREVQAIYADASVVHGEGLSLCAFVGVADLLRLVLPPGYCRATVPSGGRGGVDPGD